MINCFEPGGRRQRGNLGGADSTVYFNHSGLHDVGIHLAIDKKAVLYTAGWHCATALCYATFLVQTSKRHAPRCQRLPRQFVPQHGNHAPDFLCQTGRGAIVWAVSKNSDQLMSLCCTRGLRPTTVGVGLLSLAVRFSCMWNFVFQEYHSGQFVRALSCDF